MKAKRAFTLVELMVVVIIVGILAAVAVPMYSTMRDKAISTEILAVVSTATGAGKNYYAENESDMSGFTDLEHLKTAGFMDLNSLSGNYFLDADYSGWEFTSQGRVLKVTAGDWSVEWVGDRYHVQKN